MNLKDMEESTLRAPQTTEELNIIHNQHIHRLIENQEFRHFVSLDSCLILHLERVCTHIKHTRIGITLHNGITDSISQVGFPYSATSVNKNGIKNGFPRLFRDCQSGGTRHTIALARDKTIKGARRIKL